MLSNGVIHFNPYGRKWVRRAPSHKPVSRETEVLKNELKTVSDELQNALVELQAVTANVTTVSDSVDAVTEELQTVSDDVQTVANDVVTVSNSVQTVSENVQVVSDEKDAIKADLNYLGDHKANLLANDYDKTKKTSQINHILMHNRTMKLAMSGVMKLQAPNLTDNALDVTATTLNAATEYTVSVKVRLNTNKYNDPHLWANFDAVVSGAEDVADADVTAPTFSRNTFVEGKMILRVHFDVGEGKTYEAGDSVTATVKVSDDSKMLGHTVEDLELTFNII